MRKILLGLALALVTVCGLRADFTMNPMNGVWFGIPLNNQASIGSGKLDGQYCASSFAATPQVNIIAGQPVVYVSGGTGDVQVSGTATLGDTKFAGYAITSAFANSSTCPTTVQVCSSGIIQAYIAANVVVGSTLVTSADDLTANYNNSPYPAYGTLGCTYGNITSTTISALTGTAAITESTYLPVSQTAFYVGRSIQTVNIVGTTGTALVRFPY